MVPGHSFSLIALHTSDMPSICRHFHVLHIIDHPAGGDYDFLEVSLISKTHTSDLICSSLLRLRQELSKLITAHTDKISDTVAKATAQSKLYEVLLQGLSVRISHRFSYVVTDRVQTAGTASNEPPESTKRGSLLERTR